MPERRALLFAYHFPPGTAAGAQRWDVFTRVGVERGWRFDVVTAAASTSDSDVIRTHQVPHRKHWINERVDAFVAGRSARAKATQTAAPAAPASAVASAAAAEIGVQVLRQDEVGFPLSVTDLRRNVRASLLHLSWVPWLDDATRVGEALASAHRYDAVISSGPPHLSSEAARRAAAMAHAPLIVDFRDPWSLIDVVPQAVASWTYFGLAQRFERRVVGDARLLVMNTPRAAAAMQARYPHAQIATVPNGFNGSIPTARHDARRFLALFAGSIYIDRDPRPLLAAVARVARELALTPDDFVLRFIGGELSFGDRHVLALARDANVPDGLIEAQGAMPRRELFEQMASAALLVNLPQGAELCVPSKVYEYLHFPSWVLGLEPAGSATHDVLSKVGADVARPDDVDAIAALLRARIAAYRGGARPNALVSPSEYSAPMEGQRFFDAVEPLLANGGRA